MENNNPITKLQQIEMLMKIPNFSAIDLFLTKNGFKLTSGVGPEIRWYYKDQKINVSDSPFSAQYKTIKYGIMLQYIDSNIYCATFEIVFNDKTISKSLPANSKQFYADREIQILEELQRYLTVFELQIIKR